MAAGAMRGASLTTVTSVSCSKTLTDIWGRRTNPEPRPPVTCPVSITCTLIELIQQHWLSQRSTLNLHFSSQFGSVCLNHFPVWLINLWYFTHSDHRNADDLNTGDNLALCRRDPPLWFPQGHSLKCLQLQDELLVVQTSLSLRWKVIFSLWVTGHLWCHACLAALPAAQKLITLVIGYGISDTLSSWQILQPFCDVNLCPDYWEVAVQFLCCIFWGICVNRLMRVCLCFNVTCKKCTTVLTHAHTHTFLFLCARPEVPGHPSLVQRVIFGLTRCLSLWRNPPLLQLVIPRKYISVWFWSDFTACDEKMRRRASTQSALIRWALRGGKIPALCITEAEISCQKWFASFSKLGIPLFMFY